MLGGEGEELKSESIVALGKGTELSGRWPQSGLRVCVCVACTNLIIVSPHNHAFYMPTFNF